jgi:hypothetical protein
MPQRPELTMPAETHTRQEAVTTEDILDLFEAVILEAGDPRRVAATFARQCRPVDDDGSTAHQGDRR